MTGIARGCCAVCTQHPLTMMTQAAVAACTVPRPSHSRQVAIPSCPAPCQALSHTAVGGQLVGSRCPQRLPKLKGAHQGEAGEAMLSKHRAGLYGPHRCRLHGLQLQHIKATRTRHSQPGFLFGGGDERELLGGDNSKAWRMEVAVTVLTRLHMLCPYFAHTPHCCPPGEEWMKCTCLLTVMCLVAGIHFQVYIGTFPSEDDAARAHDKAAIVFFGDKAILNVRQCTH